LSRSIFKRPFDLVNPSCSMVTRIARLSPRRRVDRRRAKTIQDIDYETIRLSPGNYPDLINAGRPLYQRSLDRCSHDGDYGKTCECVVNETFYQPSCKCYKTCPRRRMVCDCDNKCDETCRCRGFSHGCVDDCKCRDCRNSYDDLTYPSLEVKSSNIKGAGNGQFAQE
jgi:hypothetical protein